MPKLKPSKKFLKDLEKFSSSSAMRKKVAKALKNLSNNPLHPGLNLERIVNDPKAWSVRVDRKYRISFEPEKISPSGGLDWSDTFILLRFLDHDDFYKSPH